MLLNRLWRWLKIAALAFLVLTLLGLVYNVAHTGDALRSTQLASAQATGTAVTVATNIAIAQAANTKLALITTPLPTTTPLPASAFVVDTPGAPIVSSGDAPPASIPDAQTQSAADVYNDAYYLAALAGQVAGTGSPSDEAITLMGSRILQIEAKCPGLQSSQIKQWSDSALQRVAAQGITPNVDEMLVTVERTIINDPSKNCQADFEGYP